MMTWTSGFCSLNRLTSLSIVRPSGPVKPFQKRNVTLSEPTTSAASQLSDTPARPRQRTETRNRRTLKSYSGQLPRPVLRERGRTLCECLAHERQVRLAHRLPHRAQIAPRLPFVAEAGNDARDARVSEDVIQCDGNQILRRP